METQPVVAELIYAPKGDTIQLSYYQIISPKCIRLEGEEICVNMGHSTFLPVSHWKEKFLLAPSKKELYSQFLDLQQRIKEQGFDAVYPG